METFASIEEFYSEFPRRRLSPEHDYGVWWRDNSGGTWRVSWVADTGEVYALRRGAAKREAVTIDGELVTFLSAGAPNLDGPLIVLGFIPASDGECEGSCMGSFHNFTCPADKGYHVEQAFDGWAEVCGEPGSLDWIKRRVS